MIGGNSRQRRRERRANAQKHVPAPSAHEPESGGTHKLEPMISKNPRTYASGRPIKEWLGFLGTLLGIVTSFYSFFPHLMTSDLIPMDSKNIFSGRIDVTNGGVLPVFSVQSTLIPTDIRFKEGGGIKSPQSYWIKDTRNCCVPRLNPGDSYTFSTEQLNWPPEEIPSADFTILISYIPILPPVRMNKCIHYKSFRDSGGSVHWFRSPAACPLFGEPPWGK